LIKDGGDILTTKEVMVGLELPPEMTSMERYRQVVNSSEFRRKYGIYGLVFHKLEQGALFYADFDLPYLHKGQLKRGHVNGELLSNEPLAVAYLDGGFEYLERFLG